MLIVGTREIAAVRGLIRTSPFTGTALDFGAFAIAGAPPLAVFLSEFSILKAGLAQGQYLVTGLFAIFIVIAFFGILAHVNRMVFGAPLSPAPQPAHSGPGAVAAARVPFSCGLALVLAAMPVLVLGVYVPRALQDLLAMAAAR